MTRELRRVLLRVADWYLAGLAFGLGLATVGTVVVLVRS